jgi:tetratricopeptide (TPR) repeat protein
VPPVDKDGKKGVSSPDNMKMGADDFDWDKAIDEWDPTFVADPAMMPPEISGVVVALPGTQAAPDAPAAPAAQAASAAAPAAGSPPSVAKSPTPPVATPAPAQPPPVSDGDAAPLPPPPPILLEAQPPPPLQIEIDLVSSPLPENADATMAMDAREVDRLAAMLRREEFAPTQSTQESADKRSDDDDFYDNMVVSQGASAASPNRQSQNTPVGSAATPKPSEKTPVSNPPESIGGLPGGEKAPPLAKAAAPAGSPQIQIDVALPAPVPARAQTPAPEPTPAAAAVAQSPPPPAAAATIAAAPVVATPAAAAPAAAAPVAAAPVVTPAVAAPAVSAPPAVAAPVAAAPVAAVAAAATPIAAAPVATPPVAVPAEPLPGVAPPLLRDAKKAPAEKTPLVARRLPLPAFDILPLPSITTPGGTTAPEAATRRHFLSLLDVETKHHADGNNRQAARLAVAAARQSEALREPADALDRYRIALDADPAHRPALRGTRRVLSWPGPTSQPDEATTLLEREVAESSPSEKQGLLLTRAELLRAQGLNAEAKLSLQELAGDVRKGGEGRAGAFTRAAARPGGMAALTGLLDVATAQSAPQELGSAMDSLIELYATHGSLRTMFQIERGRLDEVAGRDSAATSRYEAVFSAGSGGSLSAGLGWLRTAARLPRNKDAVPLARAYQALLGAQLPLGLHAAVQRQVALSQPPASAERNNALLAANQPNDWLITEELALHQEQSGDFAAAAATYLKLAELSREPLQRCLALTGAGEAQQRLGQLEAAKATLLQAQKVAANSDLDYDAISARALERISRTLGKPDDLLSLFSLPTGQPSEQAAYAHYLAAKIVLKLPAEDPRRGTALSELQAALHARPDYAPAVRMLSDLLIADGKHAEAGRVLGRAAEGMSEAASASEALLRRTYSEEAARLLARAGHPVEAARILVRELGWGAVTGATSLVPALRWQLEALLPELNGKADAALAEQVAIILANVADQTQNPYRAAELWYRRGTLLLRHHATPVPSLGPVEQSWQKALASDSGHGPALLSLQLRALTAPVDSLAHSALVHVLFDGLRKRMEQAMGRPEAMLWALRLGAVQEHEASDAASALLTYKQLRSFAPNHSALLGLEDTLFVTAWRAGQAFELIERRLQQEPDSDQRYALLILAGEQLEAQSQSARAAERFAQALELRPGHPVAKAALVRAYQNANMLDELARFTAAELKEATDVQTRVAAYERQALLAVLRDGGAGSEAAINAYRQVLNLDTNNHAAMRALERHFIASTQWGELVHLYEQMGLCATDTAFGVHIHLDRARLRQRLVWQDKGDESSLTNELENDFRLALYRDRHCRPALRYLLNAALRKGDHAQVAVLSTNVAEVCAVPGDFPGTEGGDLRSAAIFMTRAAEALMADGRPVEDILAAYGSALKHSREHLPALRGLLHCAVLHRQFTAAADCAEVLAQQIHDTDERYLHYMLAGVISQELLKDLPRAQRAFLHGLRLVPAREEAFERLRQSYAGQTQTKEGATALAELLSERLRDHKDPTTYQSALRLELSQLLAGPLGDLPRAKAELKTAVEQTPNFPGALYALGKLLADDEEWTPAVELLERYAELEHRPPQLVALHLMLADIYNDQLKDAQRALSHFTKVLQLQPQNQLALNKLAEIFMAQKKPAGALPILRRLVKYADDKQKKIAFYHRIAALSELSGDNRGALEALRLAVEADPMHIPALGELAKFYDRQKDVQSNRILLDRAAARFRPLLREKPRDATVLQTLLQIFLWRHATDLAAMSAFALTSLGNTLPAELRGEVEKLTAPKNPTRDGMRDPSIDDILFPPRVAPGFRALFRMLAEPLAKLYGADQKKLTLLGVDKRERLPRSGHPVRDLANKLAADLGVGEFDIYLTAAQRKDEDGQKAPLCTIEPTDPPALIISSSLLEGPEAERRFLIGGMLKLLQSNLVLPLSLSADDLGLLIGALVRQFVPNYTPLGYAEKRIANEAARLKKAIPSKLHGQLLPHAMECSAESLDFEGIAETLHQCSHHVGLLLTMDMASAISALRRKGAAAERYIDELIRFAVSDEFVELRRILTGG